MHSLVLQSKQRENIHLIKYIASNLKFPESRQIVEDCEDDNRCHVDLDWPVAAKLIKIECSILHPHHWWYCQFHNITIYQYNSVLQFSIKLKSAEWIYLIWISCACLKFSSIKSQTRKYGWQTVVYLSMAIHRVR